MMYVYMILFGIFHLSAVIQSAAVTQDTGVISTSVGNNVTLHCFCNSQVAVHFSWYRQILGGGPELLTIFYKFDEPTKVFPWMVKNPRFSVQRKDEMNHLHISDVHLSDSATYFCGKSHTNIVEFGDGVFLSVKGNNVKEITQGPPSVTVQPGASVILNCTVNPGTCDEEQVVYWFQQGSHQGILHTQRDRCRPVSTPGSPSHNCIYHLQRMNLNTSDTGTYYCAVASCGEVLFGKGNKLVVQGDGEYQMTQMRILVWLSIIRSVVVLLFVTMCVCVYNCKGQ